MEEHGTRESLEISEDDDVIHILRCDVIFSFAKSRLSLKRKPGIFLFPAEDRTGNGNVIGSGLRYFSPAS